MSKDFSVRNDHVVFVFQPVYEVDYIYQYMHAALSLHLWDKISLIMLGKIFDVFLNLVCKCFIQTFAYMFTKNIGV